MYRKPREELPEVALNTEKAVAAIKSTLLNAITRGYAWDKINRYVNEIIKRFTQDIHDVEFKKKIENGLFNFATIQYRKLRADTISLNLALLPAVIALKNSSNNEIKAKAARRIVEAVPELSLKVPKEGRYYDTSVPLQEFTETYMKRVENAWKRLATSEAKDSYSSNVSLRNVCEMQVRYEQKQKELAELIADGIDLVWISTHGNCSKRCQPFQGKLYSISGQSGNIDGISFQPLSNATDIYYTTKAGKTYKNGCISGFNCRHFLIKKKKKNRPVHIPAEEITKDREINANQREFERQIRNNENLYIGLKNVNPKEAKACKAKAKKLYDEYVSYCRKNKVAFYPSRCKAFDGEAFLNSK